MTETIHNFMVQSYKQLRKTGTHLFQIAYKETCRAEACLGTAQIFKVDEDTTDINEDKISPEIWPQIDTADHAEIKQFVDEGAFKKLHDDHRCSLGAQMEKIS